jgi:pyrroline-5-carboxylate reductase
MPDQKMELGIIGLGKMVETLLFRLLIKISRSQARSEAKNLSSKKRASRYLQITNLLFLI